MYDMDSMLPNTGSNSIMHNVNGLELLDFFAAGTNDIDQFVNLIRGETEDPFASFDHDCTDLVSGCLADNQFGPATPPGGMFGNFNAVTGLLSTNLPCTFDGEIKGDYHDHHEDLDAEEEEDQEGNDRQESSKTNTGSTGPAKTSKLKGDRSRTLISERRRRGRMKEKLYALRSIVPNITKMDKASIVDDAVRYVKELQMQAKKLKDEIGGLEASLLRPDQRYQALSTSNANNQRKFHHIVANNSQLISKNVTQMGMFQVEEKGFYMRLTCNKGDGIAVSLYKVLESLTSFNVQSSNLTSATDRVELTVTLRVKDSVREMSLANLKLLVVGALLNEGFEFKSPFCP